MREEPIMALIDKVLYLDPLKIDKLENRLSFERNGEGF